MPPATAMNWPNHPNNKMPAFVNGNKNQVHVVGEIAAGRLLVKKKHNKMRAKQSEQIEAPAANPPQVREKWQPIRPRFR